MSGDIKYKKQYFELNKRIMNVDLSLIKPRNVVFKKDKLYSNEILDKTETKKLIKKLFNELGIGELSVCTESYLNPDDIQIDYPPRFCPKNEYGESPIHFQGWLKMPKDVKEKILTILKKAFVQFRGNYKVKYPLGHTLTYPNTTKYLEISRDYSSNDKAENRWEKTKITKIRPEKHNNPPIICTNTKCEDYNTKEKYHCDVYSAYGRQLCQKRFNPENKCCDFCGRTPSTKIVVKQTIGGWLCQYCRGNTNKHINIVKRFGLIPKLNGIPILNEKI